MSPVPDAMLEFFEDLAEYMCRRDRQMGQDRQTRRRQSQQQLEVEDLEHTSPQERYEKNMSEVFNYAIFRYYIEHRIAQDALMDMMLAERNRKKKPRVIYYSN